MSHFGNIEHHLIVAIIDHIPNGWVMWKMGTFNDPWFTHKRSWFSSLAMLVYQSPIAAWWCNNHLETYEFVNGKDCPIYEMENKKCSKPPTRLIKDGIPIESSQGPVKCAWLLRRDEEIPMARLPKKNELPRAPGEHLMLRYPPMSKVG